MVIPAVQRFIARYPGTIESSHRPLPQGFPRGCDGSTSSTCSSWCSSFVPAFRSCPIILGFIGRGIPRRAGTGFGSRNRCRLIRFGRRSRTRSASQARSACPGFGTPSAWRVGGTWASTRCGCLNGVIFYVLLFATDRWQRLVPTSWDVFPNALSVMIQYLSLNWPTENGWAAYNGLQLIAYFITVFIAAPLALITGLGMSPALSTRFKRVSTIFSIQTARSLHFLVLAWFLVFIVIHVTLVFTTGLLVNLNHIYAGRNDHSWIGFWLFAASMVIVVIGVGCRDPLHDPPPAGGATRRPGRSSGRCSTYLNTSTRSPASTARRTSHPTSGTTANTPTPTSTRRCSTATSPTTGCG